MQFLSARKTFHLRICSTSGGRLSAFAPLPLSSGMSGLRLPNGSPKPKSLHFFSGNTRRLPNPSFGNLRGYRGEICLTFALYWQIANATLWQSDSPEGYLSFKDRSIQLFSLPILQKMQPRLRGPPVALV